MLKTLDDLVAQFGIGGEEQDYDILSDPPITIDVEVYLGKEVTIKEKGSNMEAYLIEEDQEGWGFPTEASRSDEING
jgi:hypothetical protein